MLNINATVAAVAFAGTVLASAGVGYVVSQATITTRVAVACPASVAATPSTLVKTFPPIGNLPSTTGGQKF